MRVPPPWACFWARLYAHLGTERKSSMGEVTQRPCGPRSARQGADHLLPPRPGGGVLLGCEPAAGVALELERAAECEMRSRAGEPPVREVDQRAAAVAPGPDLLGHRHAVHIAR